MSISNSTILLGDLSNAKPAVNSVFALLDRRSKINPFDTSGVVPKSIIGKIEFERVSFRYPTRPTVQILNGFSLSVKAGKVCQ
jgi:ATP-binding cassette subfamily B (MDR/TAP) protein 1